MHDLSVVLPGRGRPGRRLLDGVSFDLAAGERVGVVGSSGAGKSQLVAALLGLTPPGPAVSGSVLVEGTEVVGAGPATWRPLRGRATALVAQDPGTALDPLTRVGRQVGLPLRARGVGRAEAARRAAALLAEVGPPGTARRFPGQLSGGQRQRVALALALVGGPRLLVADEPTSALDPTVQAGVLDLLDRVTGPGRAGLLLVTHDLAVAARLCSRLLVLDAGRLVADAPVADVLADPRLADVVTAARELAVTR
ncbi:ATP-binding cassette domain-containing protein [Klenkia brasiliensis]|uniref:ATP-binding cassette domain-containing protein n=1 Tax=Klenkia brasiliensis TaxID=333142 RepID=UPI0013F5E690|nr:ATP-binding cassette domain-containing protein [Klenkia brasiliensis]